MAAADRPAPPVRVQPADFWAWAWASLRPYLGYVLSGLGFLFLLIGYLGVSREVFVAKQLPYLVSGGLVGLALVTLGARLLLIEDLRRDSGRLDRLEKMVEELHLALLTRVDSPVVPRRRDERGGSEVLDLGAVPAQSASHDDEPRAARAARTASRPARPGARPPRSRREAEDDGLLVLPGGSSFHREDCSVVAGKEGDAVSSRAARARGLRACRLCQPLAIGV